MSHVNDRTTQVMVGRQVTRQLLALPTDEAWDVRGELEAIGTMEDRGDVAHITVLGLDYRVVDLPCGRSALYRWMSDVESARYGLEAGTCAVLVADLFRRRRWRLRLRLARR